MKDGRKTLNEMREEVWMRKDRVKELRRREREEGKSGRDREEEKMCV